MAGLLYTYSVTSIRAAKRNAKLHREADGGQLDMRRESLRRHGVLEPVQGTTGVELFREARTDAKKETQLVKEQNTKKVGEDDHRKEVAAPRTQVEGALEEYRGRGNALKKLKEKSES